MPQAEVEGTVARLVIYGEDDFPSDLECQAVSFVRVVWSFAFAGAHRLERRLWSGWHPAHVVVEERGVLISYATVIRTAVTHMGEAYRTAGISSLFTYPSFRNEGYGRQVAEAATRRIASSDADIAMLWCEPRLERFYGASGWIATPHSETLVGDPGRPTREDDGGQPSVRMMLFVSDKGQATRPAFERAPVYVGAHTW